jgi:uncharacterized protein YfaS (alpha-2-macroglobulin family)
VYWQYFADADFASQPFSNIHISKELFVMHAATAQPVQESGIVQVGDTVRVRLTITSNHNLEYVRVADAHAAALIPFNNKRGYQAQNGLGYYQIADGARVRFFLPFLRKGVSIFEYTLVATHAGSFSNGAATVQLVFAPEFAARSKGLRIQVE